jgi:hypothetical protein
MMNQAEQLKAIEERVARKVANVNAYVTREESELLHKLRAEVGKKWDAVNARWEALDE